MNYNSNFIDRIQYFADGRNLSLIWDNNIIEKNHNFHTKIHCAMIKFRNTVCMCMHARMGIWVTKKYDEYESLAT